MDIFGCADLICNVQTRTLPSIQVSEGMLWQYRYSGFTVNYRIEEARYNVRSISILPLPLLASEQ